MRTLPRCDEQDHIKVIAEKKVDFFDVETNLIKLEIKGSMNLYLTIYQK